MKCPKITINNSERRNTMAQDKRNELIDSPHFQYILIRDFLLTNILGEDTDEVLYWSGKELARQFPLAEQDAIVPSFTHCGFGDLTLIKSEKNKNQYQLNGELVETRLLNENVSFQLEAGYLAEQMNHITGSPCEASVTITDKNEIFLIVTID